VYHSVLTISRKGSSLMIKTTPSKLASPLSALLVLCLISACSQAGRSFGSRGEGGLYLVIAVRGEAAQLDQNVQQTIAVMQRRCGELNVYCTAERQSGDKSNQIMLRISWPENPERIKSVVLSQGLELRAVSTPPAPKPLETYATQGEAMTEAAGMDRDVLPVAMRDKPDRFVIVEPAPIITGADVVDAEAVNRTGDGTQDYQVVFKLGPDGAQRLGEWTGANTNHYLAIVLNKKALTVDEVKTQMTDSGEISAHFTKEQAEDVAMVLKSGSLPAPIEALEEGTFKP
jgi:preprotein translocase subunit SecD